MSVLSESSGSTRRAAARSSVGQSPSAVPPTASPMVHIMILDGADPQHLQRSVSHVIGPLQPRTLGGVVVVVTLPKPGNGRTRHARWRASLQDGMFDHSWLYSCHSWLCPFPFSSQFQHRKTP